jgi:hypothetical protein
MNKEVLYVIGNGFDIHHGIRSRYWDFKMFLQEYDPILLSILNEYFSEKALWSDFEATLATLDLEDVKWANINMLPDMGSANWKDSGYYDFQYEVGKVVDMLTKEMKKRFTQWILHVKNFPPCAWDNRVLIDKDARYLTFNYTDTLEKIYGIDKGNILYIHNKAVNEESTLILGHARVINTAPVGKMEVQHEDDDTEDWRVTEADQILNTYWQQTYKDTNTILQQHRPFFKRLQDIKEVHVLGHSLSQVDMPYFGAIAANINLEQVVWKVSCHQAKEVASKREALTRTGVPPERIILDKLTSFYTPQLPMFSRPAMDGLVLDIPEDPRYANIIHFYSL